MKRLVINKSGKAIYGPKWQNGNPAPAESSGDLENGLHSSTTAGIQSADQSPPTITVPREDRDDEDRISEGKIAEISKGGELMYRAALEGDWIDAKKLLDRDPSLAFDYVTEEGGRALHVAVAMKNKKFVKKIVEHISNDKLALLDGRGHTACCYAAISGNVKIARILVKKSQKLISTLDGEGVTPLYKAALRGNKRMLGYLVRHAKSDDLSIEGWFDLLLVAIRGRMYDVATRILEKDPSIAKMVNKEGTALHLLAQQKISNLTSENPNPTSLEILISVATESTSSIEDRELRELQANLWKSMQGLEKASLLELIRKPHLLHNATKAGNVELVTMIIRSYPQLIWDIDSNDYDVFHIAVLHRQSEMFNLINQVEPMMGFRSVFVDKEGNNIVHLAAKQEARTKRELPPALQMRSELLWFKMVEKSAPPACTVMRNKKGLTPGEVFSEEHKTLLETAETWMRNTADSCMLIATILLTVVFAAAFTVPGGYGGQTGEPVMAKKHWFKIFLVFEVLGFVGAVVSIVAFRSIMASRFAEEDFMSVLPITQMVGFQALLLSLTGAFSAFMSSVLLLNLKMNGVVWFGFCTLYLAGGVWVVAEFGAVFRDIRTKMLIQSTKHPIFKPPGNNAMRYAMRCAMRYDVTVDAVKFIRDQIRNLRYYDDHS